MPKKAVLVQKIEDMVTELHGPGAAVSAWNAAGILAEELGAHTDRATSLTIARRSLAQKLGRR